MSCHPYNNIFLNSNLNLLPVRQFETIPPCPTTNSCQKSLSNSLVAPFGAGMLTWAMYVITPRLKSSNSLGSQKGVSSFIHCSLPVLQRLLQRAPLGGFFLPSILGSTDSSLGSLRSLNKRVTMEWKPAEIHMSLNISLKLSTILLFFNSTAGSFTSDVSLPTFCFGFVWFLMAFFPEPQGRAYTRITVWCTMYCGEISSCITVL